MSVPTCATCRAYLQLDRRPGRPDGGRCLRHPPQAVAVERGIAGGSTIETHRPWVYPTEGCFDHLPIPTEPQP